MASVRGRALAERRGKVLAKVRHHLGKTQAIMARSMEVHPATLASWEVALRPMPAHRLDQLKVLVTSKRWTLKPGVTMVVLLNAIEEVR